MKRLRTLWAKTFYIVNWYESHQFGTNKMQYSFSLVPRKKRIRWCIILFFPLIILFSVIVLTTILFIHLWKEEAVLSFDHEQYFFRIPINSPKPTDHEAYQKY